jgi:hypothetical protein
MLTFNPVISIERVIANRLLRGATVTNIICYLNHLKDETWKGNPYIRAEIDRIKLSGLVPIEKEMIYYDGRHKTEVLATREIKEESFNPICHHLLDKVNMIQILINHGITNDLVWINVFKRDVSRGK